MAETVSAEYLEGLVKEKRQQMSRELADLERGIEQAKKGKSQAEQELVKAKAELQKTLDQHAAAKGDGEALKRHMDAQQQQAAKLAKEREDQANARMDKAVKQEADARAAESKSQKAKAEAERVVANAVAELDAAKQGVVKSIESAVAKLKD